MFKKFISLGKVSIKKSENFQRNFWNIPKLFLHGFFQENLYRNPYLGISPDISSRVSLQRFIQNFLLQFLQESLLGCLEDSSKGFFSFRDRNHLGSFPVNHCMSSKRIFSWILSRYFLRIIFKDLSRDEIPSRITWRIL